MKRAPGRGWWTALLMGVCFLLAVGSGVHDLEGQIPPPGTRELPDTVPGDTVPVDSTRLLIEQQLQGLARPPGVDSTYFLPDSLLPDSLRELREAMERGRRPGRRGGASSPAGAGLAGGDSIVRALKELEGYTVTEYQSQGADFRADERRLILIGSPENRAQLVADGVQLLADSLNYSEEAGKVWSTGTGASFQPGEGDPVESRTFVFDLDQERGTALDATTKYTGGADWIVHGDLTSVTDTASFGSHLAFTSCELEEPHYHFASNNVKIVRGNLLVARPVLLYFADVPVAWLPFMVQNLEQGRASGILTPTFSINDIIRTSQGYSRRISNVGFYWAMSDYYDTTVFLDWWSGEHVALTGSLRFEWAKQFLGGGLSFRRFWRENGSKELAFDGNANWEMSERTKLRFRGRYASSNSMVRRTSFNPMEVVQSIDSEGGLQHRFDFGNLTLSANRKQFLTDDRVEMTLPNLSFSLSPQTFFKASPSQARFYNNITWSGSASFRRNSADRPEQPDTAQFNPSQADFVRTSARLNTSFNLGGVSLGGGFDYSESLVSDVPLGSPASGTLGPWEAMTRADSASAEAGWSASLGYQQRLVGSTTITPSVSISGRMKRSDRDPLASSFVSGPTRLSVGVNLRTDLYGFFPGFGSFEAVRHKLSPGFDFSYSPEVSPTDLQRDVFGVSDVRAQRSLRISLNQTFEAKQIVDPGAGLPQGALPQGATEADSLALLAGDTTGMALDSLALDSLALDSLALDSLRADSAGVEPQEKKVTILSLNTSAVSYDFEEAAERGDWLWGITNTVLNNTISSDYLRGLNITMSHDLFEDETGTGGGAGTPSRKFSPHLSSLNFGFSLDSESLPFRLLGQLLGAHEPAQDSVRAVTPAPSSEADTENPFAPTMTDESSIVPTGQNPSPRSRGRSGGGTGFGGNWNANLRFSMQRPRSETAQGNQMLQGTVSFDLTENWSARWRTSYDLLAGSFNDHFIQLTRNLHRWEAHFDFRKTATGNWSFRFEVALTDQEDLHFEYSQRSYQDRTGIRRF
jgi:hypothetical protein